MAIRIDVARLVRDINRVQRRFQIIGRGTSNREELHRRWGIQALNWVDQNFRTQGALTGAPWAKLRPNTVAGRRRKSATVLQDTGLLKSSFHMRYTSAQVSVGSPLDIAKFHEYGTKPFDIRPVRARALAFPVAEGGGRVRYSFSSTITQKTYRKGQRYGFAFYVKHPGLRARPMLPRKTYPTFMSLILRTTINFIQELKRRGGPSGNL